MCVCVCVQQVFNGDESASALVNHASPLECVCVCVCVCDTHYVLSALVLGLALFDSIPTVGSLSLKHFARFYMNLILFLDFEPLFHLCRLHGLISRFAFIFSFLTPPRRILIEYDLPSLERF